MLILSINNIVPLNVRNITSLNVETIAPSNVGKKIHYKFQSNCIETASSRFQKP
jgi:hypothetical protein